VRPMRAQRSLINAEQVPFDRIEQLRARQGAGREAAAAVHVRRCGSRAPKSTKSLLHVKSVLKN